MKQTDTRPLFSIPWADQADSSTIATIPQSATAIGRASMALGFPKATMTPIAAGGVPPYGEDMNGILNMLSRAARTAELGILHPFSADYATAINGYPVGATIAHPTIAGRFLICTADNNTNDPSQSMNGWLDPLGNYATATALQQETQRAQAAEAELKNSKVNRSGDTMGGPLAIQYTKNWGFGRGGGEFDLKMGDGPERFYGQLYRGTGEQTQGILGISDETGDHQWKLRSNGSVLSPGGGVLPEVLGLSGRVVTQCFRIQNPADIQYVPFPVAFNCADPVNQIFILLGYGYNANGGKESSVTYLYKQRTTNQGFYLDRSSSGFDGVAFDAVAIGVM